MTNEKRLIDVNDALEVLCNYCGVEGCCPKGGCAEYQKISKLPTVDAVEVVRCKECAVPHNQWTGCPKLNGLVPPPDFYCAYGERKDNGD